MSRGRVVLETIKHRVTMHAWKRQVESYRRGPKLPCAEKGIFTVLRHETFEPSFMRKIHQESREIVVILDDQKHVVVWIDLPPVVADIHVNHGRLFVHIDLLRK